MLIENTEPCARQVGEIYLIPGVNQIDKKEWERHLDNGYKRSIDKLLNVGILRIEPDEKVTIALVKKTYKVDILEEWLSEAKGPLKGAIKKQIDMMTEERRAG